ncbi:MAG: carboxypeptidase-like regulatory domain-containing protein, partial [Bacteroidota bacterium]
MRNSSASSVLFLGLFLLLSIPLFAQTGKITGTVRDDKTKEPLISVNVIVEGTTVGASTNLDGSFTILNVPPGMHLVRASMIGYTTATMVDVRVSINQTTTIDFELSEAIIEAQEVIVIARRPIVERDVAASRANISAREVENLPISQVSSVIGLQAGIQGLTVRGGDPNQTAFVVNGITFRDERDNTPYTGISLLAVQDLQIQTGGFSAEYGQIRSGLVNVVTKEGSPTNYNIGAIIRYSPPTKKYFGMQPNNFDSYWIRPFLDDAVAWTGTANGAWDPWTQAQYKPFEGWNSVSQKLISNDDPT